MKSKTALNDFCTFFGLATDGPLSASLAHTCFQNDFVLLCGELATYENISDQQGLDGGDETLVLDKPHGHQWRGWALAQKVIYFFDSTV